MKMARISTTVFDAELVGFLLSRLPAAAAVRHDPALPLQARLAYYRSESPAGDHALVHAIARELGREPAPPPQPLRPDPLLERRLGQAWRLIAKQAPAAGAVLARLLGRVLLVEHGVLIAASAPAFPGRILLAPKRDWRCLDFVEAMVHEASHLDLFLRQSVDPLVRPGPPLPSPLRSSLRPPLGVLHAAFVLRRVTMILCVPAIAGALGAAATVRLALRRHQLGQALSSLACHDDFTPAGRRLLHALEKDGPPC
jgi:HEXXH motif-containing protein